ncbi:cytochrome P450 monooxygenase-like protein, partial [Amylocarpus encephaloides]
LQYILYTAGVAIHNIYFHPLSKFPGPACRAAFHLPGIWEMWSGWSVQNIYALHEKYGNVVRIAPDALSFNTAPAWKDIYGFQQDKKQIEKDYKRFPDVPDPLPILTSNDTDHARMRRLVSHAFSENAIQELLPLIATYIDELVNQIQTLIADVDHTVVDMNKCFNCLSFDIVSGLSFGEAVGALKGDYSYIETFFASCKLYPIIPTAYEYSAVKMALDFMMMIPKFRKTHEMGYLATKAKVERRMEHEVSKYRDFMTYILRHNDERGMTKSEITGSTTVLVNAGGEATAACMAAAIYYLLRNPDCMEKLVKEVREAYCNRNDITARPLHLVYLNAVVEEVLRIYPPTPGLFSRRTGVGGKNIDGYFVPPNTSLGVHPYSANHSSANFTNPQKFVPERWLPIPPSEYSYDIRDARQPWSTGPRNCIGRSLAYLEIRTSLASVLWSFDMMLCEESREWASEQRYNIVWNRPELKVKLSRRRSIDCNTMNPS